MEQEEINQMFESIDAGISVNSEEEISNQEEITTILESKMEEIMDINLKLKENPKDIIISEHNSRFSGAIWAQKAKELNVILAGVGGIGSWTALMLARLGVNIITLYDDDVVEPHNISGQLYSINDSGRNKVTAINDLMIDYANYYSTNIFSRKFTSRSSADKIMICGFDNMVARKTFFNAWYQNLTKQFTNENFNPKEYLFIDGRLAAEEFQVFCLRGDDIHSIQRYANEFLFNDSEAELTVCSYKQTTFMSNMIASIINNLFVNFTANLVIDGFERDLPFMTTYQADYMIFKTVS